MSHYDKLDSLILARIGRYDKGVEFTRLNAYEIRAEAERLCEATDRYPYRMIDGRLQALRRTGKIKFDSKSGWHLL